ncbi:MAG: hypothetical protein SWE60_02820, partial [Thermodesulfobacteriota bacterium]|nr:hypothetical protein [Thermodesulfobacteriota bacterium]
MMALFQAMRQTGPFNKWLIGLATGLFLYTALGFVVLPALFQWILTKKLTEGLHRHVTIEDVDVNPYCLSSAVEGF